MRLSLSERVLAKNMESDDAIFPGATRAVEVTVGHLSLALAEGNRELR